MARGLTIEEVMAAFVVWLKYGQCNKDASRVTGISEATMARLVNYGRPRNKLPPFKKLVEQYGDTDLLLLTTAHDESLKNYKWSRRKAVAQTLQICEGLRQQIRDAVLSGELKIKTPEDAAKMAQAVKSLEESMTTVAKSMDLVEGETPDPKRASRGPRKSDMKSKSVEELRAITGADVVPVEKKGAA